MPFELTIGRPGTGKSMYTAKLVLWALKRAEYIYKKLGVVRKVALNFHINQQLQKKYHDYLYYWTDPMQLIELKDFDLFIDEIANYFPSDKWKDTHYEVRRMFAQHRKRGMEIFANTQDYRMVDINCRRMLSRVFQLFKIIGSRSPSATLPKIKHPWGVIAQFELDPETLEDDKEKERVGLPTFFFITKKLVDLYDTKEDIKPAPPPNFHHITRSCVVCRFRKDIHI